MGTEVEQNRKATRGSLKKGSGLLMSISVIGFLFFLSVVLWINWS